MSDEPTMIEIPEEPNEPEEVEETPDSLAEAAAPETLDEEAAPPNKRRKMIMGCSIATIVTLCCCLVVAAIVIFTDPFKWHILERINGTYDAAAANLPANTAVYVAVDMLGLTDPNAERVLNVFQELAAAGEEPKDINAQLDESLNDKYGLTFSNDILPWMNRYAGIAILDFELDQFGELQPEGVAFLLSVANTKGAEAFAEKLIAGVESSTGQTLVVETYGKTEIHVLDADFDSDDMAFALTKGIFILADNADTIKTVLDAPESETLMNSAAYRNALAALPNEPFASFYLSTGFYATLLESLSQNGNPFAANPTLMAQMQDASVMMGLSFNEVGVVLDIAAAPGTDELYQQAIDGYAALETNQIGMEERFPAETYFYVQGFLPEGQMAQQLAANSDSPEFKDMEVSIALLENELGFNLFDDFLVNLESGMALGLVAAEDGFLVESENINMGLVFISGVHDTTVAQGVVDGLNTYIESEFFLPPSSKIINGEPLYFVGDPFGSTEFFAYGLLEDELVLGTSVSVTEDLFNGGDSLAQNARYQALWESFPSSAMSIMYVDIDALMQVMSDNFTASELANAAPFTRLGIVSLAPEDGFVLSSILLIVESE